MKRKDLTMKNLWLKRFGAATGAIYILIGLLRGGGNDGPGFHASRAQIVTWIHTSSTITSARYAMAFVELMALLCFLVFVAYVSSVLRRAEGEFGYLSTTALSAGILSVALKIASFPMIIAAYVWAKDGVDPKVIGMLWDMGSFSFVLTLAANGLLVAAVAAVAIPTRVLPRWLGWGSVVTSLALFANVAIYTPDNSPAMLLFMLWTLVTSIVLVRRAGTAVIPAAPPAMREPALAH
jgi:hypothetical protein